MTERFRDRHRAFREQEIVRTAAQVLAQVGCRAFTMNEVATRLGVSKATLYQHFRSRDELIRRHVGESCRATIEAARAGVEGVPPEDRPVRVARFLVGRCLGVSGGEGDPPPCCLAEIECPFLDWGEMDVLFGHLGAGPGRSRALGLFQALRVLSASVLQRRRAEGSPPTASDVDAVVGFFFPEA